MFTSRSASPHLVNSLRALLLAAVLIPIVLFAVFAMLNRQIVMDRAEERVRRSVDILHEHARNVFRTHETVLDYLDDRIAGMSWDEVSRSEDLHRYLATTVSRIREISSIWLIDEHGLHRSSSYKYPTPPMDVSDRGYFQALQQADVGTVIGKPSIGKATGTPFFSIARRRSAASGAFEGVVSAAIDPSFFNEFYESIIPEPNRAIVLVREDGSVLARDPVLNENLFKYRADGFFMQAFGSGTSGVFTATGDMDGVERLYAFRKLDGYSAYIMLGLARAGILDQWYRNLAEYAAFGLPLWALLVLAAWVGLQRARKEAAGLHALAEEMQRREAAERALLQSQKLEAVGQLTGGLAHDFNNLLTVILGNLELIVPKLKCDPVQLRKLQAVQEAALRGTRLIRQLLAFARRQSLEPETVDLAAGVKEVSELLNRSLRGDIETEIRLAQGLWPITVDRSQLEMAILNIAVNARDAMPDGGVMSLEARNVSLAANGDPSAAEAIGRTVVTGDFVALTIADTGEGIAPDRLKRVFEPFFTTKEVGKGTGLGLSQVYGFVTQSGGDAIIESEPGHGTRVTLLLPRAAVGALMPVEPIREAARPPAVDKSTILVVEDDPMVAEVVRAAFDGFGHQTALASSAEEALTYIRTGSSVDLVFSDVVMPGRMNGIELAREIRKRKPGLPIVLATGSSDISEDVGSVFPVVRKPYTAASLEAIIGDCLLKARLSQSA